MAKANSGDLLEQLNYYTSLKFNNSSWCVYSLTCFGKQVSCKAWVFTWRVTMCPARYPWSTVSPKNCFIHIKLITPAHTLTCPVWVTSVKGRYKSITMTGCWVIIPTGFHTQLYTLLLFFPFTKVKSVWWGGISGFVK